MPKQHPLLTPRSAVQIMMMAVILAGALLRGVQHSLARYIPELQGFCPVGAVQTLFRFVSSPSLMLEADRSHLWVILGVLSTALLFGAVFCSYLCPLGTLQEWMGRAGRRIMKHKFNRPVSQRADVLLGMLRYLFILWIALAVFGIISFNLDLVNPSSALAHIWTQSAAPAAIALLGVILVLSLLYERPWCRWLCPYGLILGLLGKLSLLKLRRFQSLCINCGTCDRSCYARIPVSQVQRVTHSRCISCGVCSSVCPVEGALSSSWPKQEAAMAVLVPLIFFAPVTAAWAAGIYLPPGSNRTEVIDFDPAVISPVIALDELAGQMGIEYHELTDLLGLPRDYDPQTMLFDIEEDPDFEHITVGYVRTKVLQYAGQEE